MSNEENPAEKDSNGVPYSQVEERDVYSVEDAIEKVGFGKFQVKVLFLCGFCWMADAMEIMLLSFLLVEAKEEFNLNNWEEATLASSVFIGMATGSYFWGYISDRFGRKIGFFGTALFTAIFGMLSALSPSYLILLISRALAGFGLGGAPVAFSLFAEFLPANQRGIPLILFEIFWTVGTIGEAGLAWYSDKTIDQKVHYTSLGMALAFRNINSSTVCPLDFLSSSSGVSSFFTREWKERESGKGINEDGQDERERTSNRTTCRSSFVQRCQTSKDLGSFSTFSSKTNSSSVDYLVC